MFPLHGNYTDLLIIIFLLFYAFEGLRRGLLSQLAEMAGFILSFLLALRFYSAAAAFFADNFSFFRGFANAAGFIAVAVLGEIAISYLLSFIYQKLPRKWFAAKWNRRLGFLPAALDGLVLLAFVLTAVIVLPISGQIKSDVLASRLGGAMVNETVGLERSLDQIFGGAVRETLGFLTVKPGSDTKIDLHFQTTSIKADSAAEAEMFNLVNRERTSRGLRALTFDNKLRGVARAHSADMFARGYFAHVNPDGHDPFWRMQAVEVTFLSAGENLAYAPSVTLAHNGLMNSPEHRDNILNPEFGRVGIGVANGSIYGMMFTQDFTN